MDSNAKYHRNDRNSMVLFSGWAFSALLIAIAVMCWFFAPNLIPVIYRGPASLASEEIEFEFRRNLMERFDSKLLINTLNRFPYLANHTPAMVGHTRTTPASNPPIVDAVSHGFVDAVAMLAKAGANLDATSPVGNRFTSLHFSIGEIRSPEDSDDPKDARDRHTRFMAIAKDLLVNGANPNPRDIHGRTPLFLAIVPESIDLLMEHGADASTRDNRGDTVIHDLFRRSIEYNLSTIVALAKHRTKVDFSARDVSGLSPRDYLMRHPKSEELNKKILMQSGMNLLADNGP